MITYTFLAIMVIFSFYCFNNREAMNKYLFHPYSIHHHKQHCHIRLYCNIKNSISRFNNKSSIQMVVIVVIIHHHHLHYMR
jgi:hypothetical protein